MSDLKKIELEAKIAFLERHVEAQDLEIHKLHQRLDRLAARTEALASSLKAASDGAQPDLPHEKPPHY